RLDAAESLTHVIGEVALAELAIVEDVDAHLGLLLHHSFDGAGQVSRLGGPRRGAGVRHENAFGASPHSSYTTTEAPPSMLIDTPEMNAPRAEHKNAIRSPPSSASPTRPSGMPMRLADSA